MLRWRLRELFDSGLIGRPTAQWVLSDGMTRPAIYELSQAGGNELADRGLITQSTPPRGGGGAHFWHSLLVSQIMASIELSSTACRVEYIPERAILERLAFAKVGHVNPRALAVVGEYIVPDGLFGLRSEKGITLYALEVDRGLEPLARKGAGSSYQSKIDRYRTLIGSGDFRRLLSTPAPLLVLHVATSPTRAANLAKLPLPTERYHLFRCEPLATLAHPVLAPREDLLTDMWMRSDGTRERLQDR